MDSQQGYQPSWQGDQQRRERVLLVLEGELGLVVNSLPQNDIPVFCPALTDGSLGDMMYFHTYKADPAPLNVDIVGDIRRLNDMSVKAKQAGMIILGGGVCKHQIANAMLFVSYWLCPTTDASAQRCRLRRLHQHRTGVRRLGLWSSSRRGRVVGQDPSQRQERQGESS